MNPQNGTSTSVNERIDTLASNLKHVVESMASRAEHAKSSATSYAAKVGKYIKDHPIAALGVAFGTGYVLTRLLRRR